MDSLKSLVLHMLILQWPLLYSGYMQADRQLHCQNMLNGPFLKPLKSHIKLAADDISKQKSYLSTT